MASKTSCEIICEIIIAILLPPFGVCQRYGCCTIEFFTCLALTVQGYIPGIVYSLYDREIYRQDSEDDYHDLEQERNLMIHVDDGYTVPVLSRSIFKQLEKSTGIQSRESMGGFPIGCNPMPPYAASDLIWAKPPGAVWKLNVHGVVRSQDGGTSLSSIGGIIRDCDGQWLKGFVGQVNEQDQLRAELRAVHHGLQLAWEMQMLQTDKLFLYIDFDNMDVMECIRETPLALQNFDVIADIRVMLGLPWYLHVFHINPEANRSARILANFGFHTMLKTLNRPPVELKKVLEKDRNGC